ncbi:MAG TPA: dual specificity protein phosphatase family protein [Planctomycetota bacterium]|nr:dual specificity protein phosphatase family protein [Planctomycetota bacterium]
MTRKLCPAVSLALTWLLTGLYFAHCDAQPDAAGRPEAWAQRLSRTGLPNLHKVSDGLYRGAQPSALGVQELKKMGVKTIVNLRSAHSDADFLGDAGLACVAIPMSAWHPETEDVVDFLKIATDKGRTPVFVHCQHGADRTGMVCAVYRIVVQGWTRDDAIREMTQGGFGHHPIFRDLSSFLRDLDVDALRKAAGLTGEPGPGRK